VGGAGYEAEGHPLPEASLQAAKDADAILLGAVGGPKWDNVERDKRPEAALLALRKDMDLFANLRPAIVFDALIEASTLKPEIVRGLDILILRELTSGVYFGQPRGIEDLPDGTKRGLDSQVYTQGEIERIVRVACELAQKRNNKVTVAQKANVMETGVLWRDVSQALHDKEFPSVEFEQMYADNCAMQLIREPKQFDVIVTDNLFGDILSDEAAMMTGSLGMLPSASLGAVDPKTGKRHALYEPVHGTAPDIAGQNKANPLATILSFAMMLRYSFGLEEDAVLVEEAAKSVLASGKRTGDIMTPGAELVSTSAMGEAVLAEMAKRI
ncbi:MAG: 3-isopropylmalate dehydrogenase, partial [Alphaproteobacteria bacterium]|nr:3-isopropylmalate dehydrogenase [Alphaproteobacteria bacterium]